MRTLSIRALASLLALLMLLSCSLMACDKGGTTTEDTIQFLGSGVKTNLVVAG